jgi:hypothetical protein
MKLCVIDYREDKWLALNRMTGGGSMFHLVPVKVPFNAPEVRV